MFVTMDLDWIDEIPADEYEVGEELYFSTNTWVYVTGNYLRQSGEDIVVRVTTVMWGPEEWTNTEMTFPKDNLIEKKNLDGLFSDYTFEASYTYTCDYWTTTVSEEELNEDTKEIYNPIVIGEVITTVKGKNHIEKKDCRPRDGPTNITTMKGIRILEIYLTTIEIERFITNMDDYNNLKQDGLYHQEWRLPKHIFEDSFGWGQSPEGYDYWESIYHRVENGTRMKEPIIPSRVFKRHTI